MGGAKKGLTVGKKGQIPWNKGKKDVYSKETLEQMSLSAVGKRHPWAIGDLNSSCRLEVRKKIGMGNAGKIRTVESRMKNSISHIGKYPSEVTKKNMSVAQIKRYEDPNERLKVTGNNNGFYGCKHSKDTIEAMKQKLSILLSGSNNPAWLGGLSLEPYGQEFNNGLKDQIRKRDNFECQLCDIEQSKLNYKLIVHHIDYDKRNNLPSNLTSLCRQCHMKTNFNRGIWKDYFQVKEVSP